MSPSESCRAAGLDSLAELVRLTGESKQNLINWSRQYPRRFELLIKGAAYEKGVQRETIQRPGCLR